MEARPGTTTDVAVWDASAPASAELDAINGLVDGSLHQLAVLDDAIFNAGAATALVERLTEQRAALLAWWDDCYGQQLRDAQADAELARGHALRELQALGIKTKTYGHWTVTDVVRNDVKIADDARVWESIEGQGLTHICAKLDLPTIKRVIKNETTIDGLETVTAHSLRLTRSGDE